MLWVAFFSGLIVLVSSGCLKGFDSDQSTGKAPAISESEANDYSLSANWLSLPAKIKNVDVFYLYPTSWSKTAADNNICDINNAAMITGANAAFGRQATVFEPIGNIFAPYYRQADAGYTLALVPADREKVIGGAPTLDVVAAFDYYIKHHNNGRPYILAGHSQGSSILLNLLSGYLKDNPEIFKKMIAAYVIGYTVSNDYLSKNPHLKFATGADDTGVIISYNTQAPSVAVGKNPVILDGALVINPLTWTREETLASTSEGLGSYMPDPVTKAFMTVPQYADAKIDTAKGALITTADPTGLFLGFGPGVYHTYDYLFYYYNLRDNAAKRVAKYLSMQNLK
ncbi:MAG: DUF3089 domain-containing protein [Candidatus Riflebacteria bacterium]|nr:DUF3089 domain-containing protein [Candidatus Riflebacteria bacterium]